MTAPQRQSNTGTEQVRSGKIKHKVRLCGMPEGKYMAASLNEEKRQQVLTGLGDELGCTSEWEAQAEQKNRRGKMTWLRTTGRLR